MGIMIPAPAAFHLYLQRRRTAAASEKTFCRKSTFLNILPLSSPGSFPPIRQVEETAPPSLQGGETPLPSRSAAAMAAGFIEG
jgi:hypothetical protein